MIWLLDNGHGGLINGVYQTAGKRSPVWGDLPVLYEGVFNRELVQLLHTQLKKAGIHSEILVPEDTDVPINERINRVNHFHRLITDTVLLSLHANAGGGTGWECFTSIGQTESDRLATCLFTSFAMEFPQQRMRADYADGDPDKEADFGLLTHTTCPAVLCENFFMDNRKDCQLMQSAKGKIKMVNAYVDAITRYQR